MWHEPEVSKVGRDLEISKSRVGRTLLCDAFDLGFAFLQLPDSIAFNTKIKGVGQECPTHTTLAGLPVFGIDLT